MRQYLAGRIRNITLAGHSGSGKTSLAEALLYKSGETERLGKISDGTTVCDYDQEEIKRKTSTASAVAPLSWGSTKINLLDTPGLFDFAGGLYECINPCESVLITVCAKSGVEVGTEIAYKQAKKANKATMFFITKSDVENANFYKVFEELKSTFGPSVCPIVAPYIEDNITKCYVNLIDMKAYTYDDKGGAKEVPMPDLGHRLEGLRAAMSEAIAETDEELFEKYFSGEQFTRDEIIKGLRKGVDDGVISPLLCGSTQTLAGIDVLLDNIVDLLPSPWEKGSVVAEDKDGNPVEITCTDEAPLCAYIFKTIADPFVGKMSFFKVISGKITPSDTPVNARTGETERIGKLLYVTGKKQEETMGITAGDIGVVTKLNNSSTGDTLCDMSRVVSVGHTKFPAPTFSMAIVPKNKGDEGKIVQGILKLMQEDRTIAYENNTETKQQL
ncbi:MAG: GTP-binding protein, partial [Oscillospiraceae bacterium]